LEVSREAAEYVRDRLGIPCGVGDFSSGEGLGPMEASEGRFDVITMWYVIEHFKDTDGVLLRVNRLLKPGGVFAFSTPSAAGISGRRSRTGFLRRSPPDHYTVWSPRASRGILERFGFRLKRVVVTGHHGERFPWPGGLAPGSAPAGVFTALSRLLRLGDTFEAYAVKVGEAR
jgi:SAM-dependent methyltransferase